MKIKSLVLASALLLCSGAAFAQETNRDADGKFIYGPYETNGFWDNWFVGIQGGLNWSMNGVYQTLFKNNDIYTDGIGLNLGAYVGKWFDPCWGMRLGWGGIKADNISVPGHEFPGDINYNYFHVAGLINLSNLFAGYKETRTVDFVLYPHVGFNDNPFHEFKWAGGLGLMVPIRLNNSWHIVPDFRYEILPEGSAQVVGAPCAAGNFAISLGLQYSFNRNNWTRKATTVGGFTAALATSEALRAAAQAKSDELAAAKEAAEKLNTVYVKENQDLKDELARAQANAGKYSIDLKETPVRVFFQINKATLTPQELEHLDFYVKTILAADKDTKLVINGECDSKTGSVRTNAKLSEKRAKYLYKLLTEKYGLNPDRFEVNARGGINEYNPFMLNRACEVTPIKK